MNKLNILADAVLQHLDTIEKLLDNLRYEYEAKKKV